MLLIWWDSILELSLVIRGKSILMRRVLASMIVEMGAQAGPRLIRLISGPVWEMEIEPINY